MKILTTLLFLLSISFSAQNHRFTYNYTFTPDSLVQEKTISELMNLDITEKGSRFYSQPYFESDSLLNAEFEKQARGNNRNINLTGFTRKGVVKNVIEKSYPKFYITMLNDISGTKYIIADDRKIKWKIEPEKMMVGKFNTQKATTEMYGRKWTAWFSAELPFQDGPYKFHGLPGLIVKLESQDQSHIMELVGVKTLPKDFQFHITEDFVHSNYVEIDQIKYKKIFQNFLKNPTSPMRNIMMGNGTTISMKDQNGKEIDMNKKIRDSEEKMKEANKKINNVLELDLLK